MRYRREISVLAVLLIFMSMIIQFHHHDIHGCPMIAVNPSLELSLCTHGHEKHCNHSIPDNDVECILSLGAFVYTNHHDGNCNPVPDDLTLLPLLVTDIEGNVRHISESIFAQTPISVYQSGCCKRNTRRGPPQCAFY